MIDFVASLSGVVLAYRSDQQGNGWAWKELQDHGSLTLSRVFTFERRDLLSEPDAADAEDSFEGKCSPCPVTSTRARCSASESQD